MRWTLLPTPVDDLLIAADEHGIYHVGFQPPEGGHRSAGRRVEPDADPVLRAAADQLIEYFAGERTDFSVALSVRRGSDFERAVWHEIARIPYGETRTYGEIATRAGAALADGHQPGPVAARAVGVACNRNPLPIVVPCHRVVGAGSRLVGFGGGLHRKRFLLELEARVRFVLAFG